MKFKFFCLFILVSLLCSAAAKDSPVSAGDWHVCTGSFSKKENADNAVKKLNEEGISSFSSKTEKDGKILYRVLTEKKFDDIKEARKYRDELSASKAASELKLKGLWVCQEDKTEVAVPASLPQPLPAAVELEKNETDENFFSEEKPYSVLIQTYKEEQQANNDRDRLREKEIDSYVVKKFDEKELFSFDLNSGAFENMEEAENQKKKIEELGIKTREVTDYSKAKEAVESYDKLTQEEKVVFNEGVYTVPDFFTANILNTIRDFPVNRNFQLEKAAIIDFDNCRKQNFGSEFDDVTEKLSMARQLHAVTYAVYRDELFDREVEVYMMDCDSIAEDKTERVALSEYDFKIRDGILRCRIYKADDLIMLAGKCEEKNLYLMMMSRDFTPEEYMAFLDSNRDGDDLLIYPQFRRTLLVLPDDSAEVKRDFLAFTLEKVQVSYAKSKGYAQWALPIVGHWNATAMLRQKNEFVSVSFFDLDYDYNARSVHGIFMDEKKTAPILDESISHSLTVNGTDSWYLNNWNGKEVSFSTQSYIIAVDSELFSPVTEKDLTSLAEDLKIWK